MPRKHIDPFTIIIIMTHSELSWEEAKADFLENVSSTDFESVQGEKAEGKLPQIKRLMAEVDPSTLVSFDELEEKMDSTPLVCYNLLKACLAMNGYRLEADLHGNWCGHSIYRTYSPSIRGIFYPSGYSMLEHSSIDELHELTRCLKNAVLSYLLVEKVNSDPISFLLLAIEWGQFIKPLISARGRKKETELYGLASRVLGQAPPDICTNGRVAINTAEYPPTPAPALRSIPSREWFPAGVRELTADDICTIFPRVELEVFQLCVGRALLGPSGTIPVGYSQPIDHTYRTSLVIKGSAGSGKSQLLHLLNTTLPEFGYRTHTFRDLDGQFSGPDLAPADIAMKDDSSVSDLISLGRSSMYKTLVTGGIVNAERKFQDAMQVRPRGVIILAANDWDSNSSYSMDEGVRSRLRILETLTPDERAEGQLEPKLHVEALARKHQVSVTCIMGWFYRLCLDRFYEAIPSLEKTDKILESRLSTRVHPNPLRSLVKALRLSLLLSGRTGVEPLTSQLLEEAIQNFGCLLFDCRTGKLLDVIKADWERVYRDPHHCWNAFRTIRYSSIMEACTASMQTRVNGKLPSLETYLKRVVVNISTHGSIVVGPSPANFTSEWHSPSVLNEVRHLLELSKQVPLDRGVFSSPPTSETLANTWFRELYTPSQIRRKRASALAEFEAFQNDPS